MQRAAWVAAGVLLCALLLGLATMSRDIDNEARSAAALAEQIATVSRLAALPQPVLREQGLLALQQEMQAKASGHLHLRLHDERGQTLLASSDARVEGPVMRWLLKAHARLSSTPEQKGGQWLLPLPEGSHWTLSLQTAPQAERAEAMQSLLQWMVLMLLCIAGLLLALRLNLQRALQPLGHLLRAISSIEQRDHRAVQALAPMPVHELETVAKALRHLAGALDATEEQRRLLGQRVISLQEDERSRLGRELHDEFGQHLTALRVDAAWLARQELAQQGQAAQVLDGIQTHVRHIQQVLRGVLTRLRPLGPGGALGSEGLQEDFSYGRLAGLLENLLASWQGRGMGPSMQLELSVEDASGLHDGWAQPLREKALPPAVGLAVYRITQEALTNAVRHAQASQLRVRLRVQPGLCLQWSVEDDGLGLPDADGAIWHGSGLGGMRERVWALGADLQLTPAYPGRPQPGLRLRARLPLLAQTESQPKGQQQLQQRQLPEREQGDMV